MISKKSLTLLFLSSFIFSSLQAQEVFHEVEIGKKIEGEKSFSYFVDANWKLFYTESGWNRLGINFSTRKDFSNNWSLVGGLDNYYVSDQKTANYFELRPWIQIGLKSKIGRNIYFSQFLKNEWRNYFYNQYYNYENYHRLRYRIHLEIQIPTAQKEVNFSIKPGIEWFYLNSPSTGERFANSREYYLRFTKEKLNSEINFGYKFESFYKTYHPNALNANTLFLEYKF